MGVKVHIDELAMPRRPNVEAGPQDVEVWMDPLPDAGEEGKEWLGSSFGDVTEIFRTPDPDTGEDSDRGYVRFAEHTAAATAVEVGCATWSESERIIMSQRHQKWSGAAGYATYPESVISLILGRGGETIKALKQEIGADTLSLRGD